MANTTKISGRFITITPDGTTDWYYAIDLNEPEKSAGCLFVKAIDFHGSGADTCVLREGSATGAEIFRDTVAAATEGAANVRSYSGNKGGQPMRPYLHAADCTFTTPSGCRVTIEVA